MVDCLCDVGLKNTAWNVCRFCNDKLVQAAKRHEGTQAKSRPAVEGACNLVLTADVHDAGGAKTSAAPDLG